MTKTILRLQKRLALLTDPSPEAQAVQIHTVVLLLGDLLFEAESTEEIRALSDLVTKARRISRTMIDPAQTQEAHRKSVVLQRFL